MYLLLMIRFLYILYQKKFQKRRCVDVDNKYVWLQMVKKYLNIEKINIFIIKYIIVNMSYYLFVNKL